MKLESDKQKECPYLEPDEQGDICHAHGEIECVNPFKCSAVYNIHGDPLHPEENGLDYERLI